ncbi:MAG: hypothetical protein QM528_09215, partial [Phycisphaerales bacterium]|nr:hypothetical protein [Phycisphaerales bacterium]
YTLNGNQYESELSYPLFSHRAIKSCDLIILKNITKNDKQICAIHFIEMKRNCTGKTDVEFIEQ